VDEEVGPVLEQQRNPVPSAISGLGIGLAHPGDPSSELLVTEINGTIVVRLAAHGRNV